MATENTIHLDVNLPASLHKELQLAAPGKRITVDELIRDAVERRLRSKEWQELLAFGERHAKERGLTENDVAEAIAEVRRQVSDSVRLV